MEDNKSRSASRIYEDIQPMTEWIFDSATETLLLLRLPGFRKDQLRVQMDNHGNIRVSGERPADSALRWIRFHMEHRIPDNTDFSGIRARFEVSTLYIIFPKLITEKPTKPAPLTPAMEPEPERKPSAAPEPEPDKKPVPAPEQEPERKPAPAPVPEPELKPALLPEPEKKPPMPEQKLEPERKPKEKDEKEAANDKVDGEKEQTDVQKGNGKDAAAAAAAATDKSCIGLMARIRKPRQLASIKMIVAAIVFVVIGIYVRRKLSSAMEGRS